MNLDNETYCQYCQSAIDDPDSGCDCDRATIDRLEAELVRTRDLLNPFANAYKYAADGLVSEPSAYLVGDEWGEAYRYLVGVWNGRESE